MAGNGHKITILTTSVCIGFRGLDAANRLSESRPLVMVNRKRVEGTCQGATRRPPAMTGITASMKTFQGTPLTLVRRLLAAVVFAAFSLAVGAEGVRAQNFDLSTNNVTIDLSVIEDSGIGPAVETGYLVRPSGASRGHGLLVPGRQTPKSKFHVMAPRGAGKGRIKLRPPGVKKKKPVRRVARKKPRKPKPASKKPSAPVVAKVEPPKPPAVEKKPAAPAKPVEPMKPVAKVEPPAPPPAVAKPVVKKVAPPPPPSSTPPAAPKTVMPTEKPKPESKPAAKEQAALPPPAETVKAGRALRVKFDPKASKLPTSAKADLKALAKKLKDKENLRLQLMAFAGGKELSPSKARRMSLSRALSVRSFLIESGVRSTRIDVRALGSKTTEEPVNRVDVNIVER